MSLQLFKINLRFLFLLQYVCGMYKSKSAQLAQLGQPVTYSLFLKKSCPGDMLQIQYSECYMPILSHFYSFIICHELFKLLETDLGYCPIPGKMCGASIFYYMEVPFYRHKNGRATHLSRYGVVSYIYLQFFKELVTNNE